MSSRFLKGWMILNILLTKKAIIPLFILTILFQVILLINTYYQAAPDEFKMFAREIQTEAFYQAIAVLVIVVTLIFLVVCIYIFALVSNLTANYLFKFNLKFNLTFKIIIIYMFFATLGVFVFHILINNDYVLLFYLNPFVLIGLGILYVIIRSEVKSGIRPLIFVGLIYIATIILI